MVCSCLISHSIEKSIYDQVQPSFTKVSALSEVKEGLLLMNYPTTLLSSSPSTSFLDFDEVFLITRVNELGVHGVVLNPFGLSMICQNRKNCQSHTADYHGFPVVTITSEESEDAFKQYIIQASNVPPITHSADIHSFSPQSFIITPEIDAVLSQSRGEPLQIVRYDQLSHVPVESVFNSIVEGELISVQCENLSPLLFSISITRSLT